jgi:hypothetical protein
MNAAEENIYNLWLALARWHGPDTADLVSKANNGGDSYFAEPDLWESDPDLAMIVSDLLDVESLLDLGGCVNAS